MDKRVLVTSTDLMMIQFLVPHIINLSENGYSVEIACSNVGDRIKEISEKLKNYVKEIHIVRLKRSPIALTNFMGYKDMKDIIKPGKYDLIWTNEPVMGIVTRLAAIKARKCGTKLIYMTHGFHFYKGAPIRNWLAFYPIEKWASRLCDQIVTINREDYQRAKRMHAPSVRYIHGIGIDTERFHIKDNTVKLRKILKVGNDAFLVLSIGELNKNKNHKVIIKALSTLRDPQIHYIICGKGDQEERLKKLTKKLKMGKNVHFLGYRTDAVNICSQADVFVFPSYREGLGLAALEAMYCGLPLITSNIRGPVDFMKEGITGFLCKPDDIGTFAKKIRELKHHYKLRRKMGAYNKKAVRPYCLEDNKKEVLKVIKNII